MTLLRPRLVRDASNYPDRPVIYRRPVLRALMLVLLVGSAVLCVGLTFVTNSDGFTHKDWLWPLASVPTLGAAYLYVSSDLVVNRTHVLIRNPLREAAVPLAHVLDVIPGSNLKIVTGYKHFYAWGVEAANAQVATGSFGSQTTLQSLVRTAAASASGEWPSAGYRFRSPDVAFLMYLLVVSVCSAALRLGMGANG